MIHKDFYVWSYDRFVFSVHDCSSLVEFLSYMKTCNHASFVIVSFLDLPTTNYSLLCPGLGVLLWNLQYYDLCCKVWIHLKNSLVACVTCLFYVKSLALWSLHMKVYESSLSYPVWEKLVSSLSYFAELCFLRRHFLTTVVKVHKIPILCYNLFN